MERPVEAAITSKGQATIPKAIRDHLGLKPGGRVRFFIHPNGSVVILPKLPPTAVKGMIKPNRRATLEEMAEGIALGATNAPRDK
jgi:antitoxin PrlF